MAALQNTFTMSQRSFAFKSNVASTQGLRATIVRAQPLIATRVPLIENRVAIRFMRLGRKKHPFYRIIAIDSKARREGRPLEFLGHYDPLVKEANLNAPAIKKWLGVGAQPSDSVAALLKKAMILE